MYTSAALIDLHTRAHWSLQALYAHCSRFSQEELAREFAGFGVSSLREQFQHCISAEEYWVGVIHGRMDVNGEEPPLASIPELDAYRQQVAGRTLDYLNRASEQELNTPRTLLCWPNQERSLVPARIIGRLVTHLYQHQGQCTALCRLLGQPVNGLDFPLANELPSL
ncbi:MAG: DinB family protein [Candidatus Delongbacteria bacterium]|nr:DinB family protein [Candidatus Cloacimonadota bacterium]MCB9474150.1 DinB family protein [Candidatus Delongbacteria bacterium]